MRMRMLVTAFLIMLSFLVGMFTYAYSHNFLDIPTYNYQLISKADGSYGKGYEDGLDYARGRLQHIGIPYGNYIQMTYIEAKVKSVGSQSITVEIPSYVLDILAEDNFIKTVRVSNNTSLEKRTPKDSEQLMKEYEKYRKNYESFEYGESNQDHTVLDFPASYNVEKISLGSLKVGDKVSIESKVDIRKVDTFEAINISLISNA